MSQPPNQHNNPYGGGPQQRGAAGGYNNPRPMGAWQPAAPTSLQMASQGQQPNPQQQQQQQQQQQYGQQQPGRGGGYTVPPPQMNPYAYNPYAQQYPPSQGRVGGWNPAYAGNMYGNPNAAMYYPQGGPPPQQQQQQPQSATPGASVAAAVPAPRPKKALVITDKDGNPIDLSSLKKPSAPKAATTPAAATAAATTTDSSAGAPSSDAGSKLRQAALERIQGADAAKKKVEEDLATKKAEEEEAARMKKAEEEKEAKKKEEAEAAKKKAEEEAAAAKKKAEAEAAAKTSVKPRSSLSAMLSKQNVEKTAGSESEPALVAEAPAVSNKAPSASSGSKRKFVYSKEEMMRLKSLPVCMKRPDDLPEFVITKGPSRGGADRGGDRRQQRDGGGGGGGGGGGSWQRGAPAPRRSSTENKDNKAVGGSPAAAGGGGGQWTRGLQAPPPKPQDRGGRGGRGDRGGRGSGPPFFDGPVEPLTKSSTGWRPKKSTSVFDVAEKQVKGILNKMTKEKFDRLAAQMCEIPVVSYDILTMMIGNVYEKAIDEPTFGDMYGDLCVKLSQQVQTDSFVQIIESDEEPPTDDGETTGEAPSGQPSAHSTYRWSNDVSTSDSELVGPFSSVEECFEIALSDTEQDRVDRGEMELELVKLQIKGGIFIKILKKKTPTEAEEGEEGEYYTVYFPVANHEECGQQLSKIFLSERECMSDVSKQNSFKRSLLNKCEDEFNKQDIYVDWKKEKKAYEETKSKLTDAERAEKEEELDFRRIKIKKQMLGNIKFIGQLYKKNLLKEKIMRFCIASLLKLEADDAQSKMPVYHDAGDGDMDEEDHEAICNLFGTIGSTIDGPAAANFISLCFTKIQRLSTSNELPSRSRFMYKDLLELRQNNWIPRRKDEKAKTIDEIRKDFEQEERMKQQQSQQMASGFRGGGRNDYGNRSDNRRGTDFRSTSRPSTFGSGGGGGSGSSARRPSKPATETDDDGFTTIVGGASSKSRSSLSQAASGQASSRQSTKVETKQSFAALSEDNSATPSKPAPEPMDEDKLKRRITTICAEYMQDPSNVDELILSVNELTATPDFGTKFVQINCDRIIDCKDDERAAVNSVLAILVQNEKLTSSDVKAGMMDLIEFIDSFVWDAPKAFDYLGDMLATTIQVKAVDVNWICEQAAKTKASSEENPGKIMQSLATAMKNIMGADEARSILDASASAIEGLIGPDKLASIKAGL